MGTPNVGEVEAWLERYRRAWEDGDAEAAAALFTDDAVYRSSPFREPHLGQDGVRDYWARATGTQTAARALIGRPVVDGDRVAVEWWATYTEADEGEGTLPGILMLRFAPDGRCAELRETWNWEAGTRDPHPGWGA